MWEVKYKYQLLKNHLSQLHDSPLFHNRHLSLAISAQSGYANSILPRGAIQRSSYYKKKNTYKRKTKHIFMIQCFTMYFNTQYYVCCPGIFYT